MIYYCTNCWQEIKKDEYICTKCGSDQNNLAKDSYKNKLLRALNHPEPQTPVRAANILAELKVKEAVPLLLSKLRNEKDPFLIEAFVKSILMICPGEKEKIKTIMGENLPIRIKKLIN